MSVYALALSPSHTFSKTPCDTLTLLTGVGIAGDIHAGKHVQHQARISHNQPPRPNLRQVHLLEKEVLDSRNVKPSEMGENITTLGMDLVGLGRGTKLHFLKPNKPNCDPNSNDTAGHLTEGALNDGVLNGGETKEEEEDEEHAIIVITGLRNPCWQIDKFRKGLKEKFVIRDDDRKIIKRSAGVLATVERGGVVERGMRIVLEEAGEFVPLEVV